MRKLILVLLIFVSQLVSAQTTLQSGAKFFCLAPVCDQSILTTDSTLVYAQLTTSDGYKSITWRETSGKITLPSATVVLTGTLQGFSYFQLKSIPAGTYTIEATGTSSTGVTGIATTTLKVSLPPKRIVYTVTVYSDSTRVITQ